MLMCGGVCLCMEVCVLMCGGVCACVWMCAYVWRCVLMCLEVCLCVLVFGGVLFLCVEMFTCSKLYNVGHVQRVPTFGGGGVAYNLSPETQLLTSQLWDHYRRLVVTVN